MSYETPPRGSGRHSTDSRAGADRAASLRRAAPLRPTDDRSRWRGPPPDDQDRYEAEADNYGMPTDPSMRAPLNLAPRHPAGGVSPRYQDLVVPRVYVEPDEAMDRLRCRSLRWAITRDVLAVLVLLYAIGWMTRPLWAPFL